MKDVSFKLYVSRDTFRRRCRAVVEGFRTQIVHAAKLQMPGFNLIGQTLHDAYVLVLVEASVAGGEDQDLRASMAKDEEFHVSIQAGAVPAVVFAVHKGVKKADRSSRSRVAVNVSFGWLK